MRDVKKWISLALAASLLLGAVPGLAETDDFSSGLEARYVTPDRAFATEVRWWMAEGAHTDETLLEEIQAIYDAGFRGMELCEQVDPAVAETEYGYGSAQWDHDLKLVLNKALDLGMTVSLTSGTNWAPSLMLVPSITLFTAEKHTAGVHTTTSHLASFTSGIRSRTS